MSEKKVTVHQFLSLSYSIYLIFFLLGILLEIFFPFRVLSRPEIGFFLLFLGTIFIIWAQESSRISKKQKSEKPDPSFFTSGPYKFTRSPTSIGLTFLMLGFGAIAGAPFILITTFISFLISQIFIFSKVENILEYKYGEAFSSYKKRFKRIF